jgi:ABC-type oligopeptide transport system substrate-binding subunit
VIQEDIRHGRVEKMWGFIFNSQRPPFDNRDVRKALSLMIDYDWINRNMFYGQYHILTSYFPNASLAATGKPSAGEVAPSDPVCQRPSRRRLWPQLDTSAHRVTIRPTRQPDGGGCPADHIRMGDP